MSNNKRVWYAVEQIGIAKDGFTTYTSVKGLQSAGTNTKFNLENIFEIGQSETYEIIENVPEVEVTMEKVIDGAPLLWHLMTQQSTLGTLIGRSNAKAAIALSIYSDLYASASGTPLAKVSMSGMFPSNVEYTLPVNGNCMESVTAVGNNKRWDISFTPTSFANTDTPPGSGGVQRRENVILGISSISGVAYASRFPLSIPGTDASGQIALEAGTNGYLASLQQVKIAANMGRESLYELGHKGPFHRFVSFPVEVRTDIEVLAKQSGDQVSANETLDTNTNLETIYIMLTCGTIFNLGARNKLSSVTHGGANAGQGGGNATETYSYVNQNYLTITDPSDPAGL